MAVYRVLVSFFLSATFAWMLSGTELLVIQHFTNSERSIIETAIIDNPNYDAEPCNKVEVLRLLFDYSSGYSIIFKNFDNVLEPIVNSTCYSKTLQGSARNTTIVFRVLRI